VEFSSVFSGFKTCVSFSTSGGLMLNDSELILKLKDLVARERDLIAEVLRHLREVEERRLYLTRGHSSMFAFCTEALGYSEAEAHIRIQAMRLMRSVPALETKIETGAISLSVAAKAQSCFRRENVSALQKREILEQLTGCSTREAERQLAGFFPQSAPAEKEKPLSKDLTRIEFTATSEQLAKFHKLKNLLAHQNFEGRYDLLFEKLADMALTQLEPKSLRARDVQNRHSRYIPRARRLRIREKAQGQCQYIDEVTGRRCSSQHGLQIDHILEHSKGGLNAEENLRLLCGAHNRHRNWTPT
jgi:hypothetical protein